MSGGGSRTRGAGGKAAALHGWMDRWTGRSVWRRRRLGGPWMDERRCRPSQRPPPNSPQGHHPPTTTTPPPPSSPCQPCVIRVAQTRRIVALVLPERVQRRRRAVVRAVGPACSELEQLGKGMYQAVQRSATPCRYNAWAYTAADTTQGMPVSAWDALPACGSWSSCEPAPTGHL